MNPLRDVPTLYVEGKDDKYTIIGLLQRHGVDMSFGYRPLEVSTVAGDPAGAEGMRPLLDAMSDAIRSATNRPIGFVLDIDVKTADRWAAVSHQLRDAGLSPPPTCPVDGYIDRLVDYQHSIGVWLMPDCIRDHGKLEHLLKTLVAKGDVLWPHSEAATDDATKLGAAFAAADRDKAITHCWLAWQRNPGVPFGTAITAKYFGHDSPEAIAFLGWLERLFRLAVLPDR